MQDLSSLLLNSKHFLWAQNIHNIKLILFKLDSKKDSDLCVLQNVSQAVYLI